MNLKTKIAVIDFETYYDKEYSVSSMSYWHYCHHEKFDPYLVSIVTSEGFEWVGQPKDAPWESVRDHAWVSHNRPFDLSVYLGAQALGIVPNWVPAYWGNSANLCAYHRLPRALAKAVAAKYGIKHSKTIRDKTMLGAKWSDHSAKVQEQIKEYALEDSRLSLRLWLDLIDTWPEKERRLADSYDDRGLRGLSVDVEGLNKDVGVLQRVLFVARSRIPWAEQCTDGEGLLAREKLDEYCRSVGLVAPASLDMKNADCSAWEEEHGDKHPVIGAMRDYRRANSVLMKYETIRSRTKPDGRFEFPASYMGTHTGRSAGTDKNGSRGGLNMLNMPRDPFFVTTQWNLISKKEDVARITEHIKKNKCLPDDIIHAVDLRRKIIPGPGKKFIICDKSQIEARITVWLAKDRKTLELIRSGVSVYEAHAIQTMGWVSGPVSLKKKAPQVYSLAKARVLALGFNAGHSKFLEMAKLYVSEEEYDIIFSAPQEPATYDRYTTWLIDTKQNAVLAQFKVASAKKKLMLVNSWLIVEDFRAKNPGITALWKSLDNELKAAIGTDYEIELPSGRSLKYHGLRWEDSKTNKGKKDLVCNPIIGGPDFYPYGGKLLENCLAGDTEVFVKYKGWTPITYLNPIDPVWDGVEFVDHGGVIRTSEQPVVDLYGVRCTEDHRFLTVNEKWVPAGAARYTEKALLVHDHTGSPPSTFGYRPSMERVPVYDIMNCGPRNRFAVKGDYCVLIAHNCAQAIARDCFLEDQLNLIDAGYEPVLDVYDEVVVDVPLETDPKEIERIMSLSPEWAKTLPVGAEAEESMYYKK